MTVSIGECGAQVRENTNYIIFTDKQQSMSHEFGYKEILRQIDESPDATIWDLKAIQSAFDDGRITQEEQDKLIEKLNSSGGPKISIASVNGKIAIDVVILLPTEVMYRCIDLNQELKSRSKIILDANSCYPHISLAMGVVKKNDLPNIYNKLEIISSHLASLTLTVTKLYCRGYAGLKIEKTAQLQSLHERIMDDLSELMSYELNSNMLAHPSRFDVITRSYVKNFRNKHAFIHYSPHITLGFGYALFGKKFMTPPPTSFTGSKIAICHLGRYCTCREILKSF